MPAPILEGYEDTLRRLQGLGRLGVRLGLERMERVMSALGDPQRSYSSVHLAGTNGKGSTAAMIASCLVAAGIRTGLYISPHLSRFTERIQIDGREVDQEQVTRLAARVLGLAEGLSFFEAVTAMALLWFAEEGAEVAVLETGLGGRLDATNVVTPRVCVLTRIDIDHTDLLGTSLTDIAREKAGIVKPGVPVVSAPCAAEVERVLRARCAELRAPLWLAGHELRLSDAGDYAGPTWRVARVEAGLSGGFQRENAALCLAALERLRAEGVRVDEEHARRGLREVRWPGRMERIGERHLVDGAHNPCGARALAASLPGDGRFSVVFGLLGERDVGDVLAPLLPRAARVIFTRARSARAVEPGRLARRAAGRFPDRPFEVAPDLAAALASAARYDEPVLITGSLYLVGEARELLAGERADPLQATDPLPKTPGVPAGP